jgi:hypothetical protein
VIIEKWRSDNHIVVVDVFYRLEILQKAMMKRELSRITIDSDDVVRVRVE